MNSIYKLDILEILNFYRKLILCKCEIFCWYFSKRYQLIFCWLFNTFFQLILFHKRTCIFVIIANKNAKKLLFFCVYSFQKLDRLLCLEDFEIKKIAGFKNIYYFKKHSFEFFDCAWKLEQTKIAEANIYFQKWETTNTRVRHKI